MSSLCFVVLCSVRKFVVVLLQCLRCLARKSVQLLNCALVYYSVVCVLKSTGALYGGCEAVASSLCHAPPTSCLLGSV